MGHGNRQPEVEPLAHTAAGATGKTPFELLGEALVGLVEAGLLAEDRRPAAEFLAWSAVHGPRNPQHLDLPD
ncbi:hypothetical protein ACWGLF_44300 [Streptomyces puniciscabiei]